MAITVHLIGSDEKFTEYVAEPGDVVSVEAGQRVLLPDVAGQDAGMAIDASDVLTVLVGGQTLPLPGLLSSMENETGSVLAFGDGTEIDSLGALLGRASLPDVQATSEQAAVGMADLVREDADAGDLFYVENLTAETAMVPPRGGAGEVLELGELVDVGSDGGALFELSDGTDIKAPAGASANDLWANTEFGGQTAGLVPQHHGDGDIFDLLLSGEDGIS